MKKIIFTTGLLICYVYNLMAQGEQNIWTFGNKAGLSFNAGGPVYTPNNLFPAYEGSATVCDAGGNLLFYTNGLWVWNSNHELMPELTGGISGYTGPVAPLIGYPPMMLYTGGFATQPGAIAGVPGQKDQYYIFSLSTSGQLFYSVIDMSLNSGKGGVVSGKKGVFLTSGLCEKMTMVKGCNSIWLVVRAKAVNAYYAYEIGDAGISTTPVVSACGSLPLAWYNSGVIKFSPDGNRMAAACNAGGNTGGLELYDFDKATGRLSHPLVLDSGSTTGYYYGACFSPGNTKLYATVSSYAWAGNFYFGAVKQFDVSLPAPAAVIASGITLLTDYTVYEMNNMGDLKRGPDGKIYFGSGRAIPSGMHCITAPDMAGPACNLLTNVLTFPAGIITYRGLPNDIALLPRPDTLRFSRKINVCFRDSVLLAADTGKAYRWQDGSTGKSRYVKTAGTYTVTCTDTNCKYVILRFNVQFIKAPALQAGAYICPRTKKGMAWATPATGNDTTTFQYTWTDADGRQLQQHWQRGTDTIRNLDTGICLLRVRSAGGCDTLLQVQVLALPLPSAAFLVDSIACKGEPLAFTKANAAPQWKWFFGDGNNSVQENPLYAYNRRGNFTASLAVMNAEGCADTARKTISVKGLDLTLTADRYDVHEGDPVQLQAGGSEPYAVTAWLPVRLCPDQTAYSQVVYMDSNQTFIVTGRSLYGCSGKAAVDVTVIPFVFMPTGFTPNGDGVNDRFRPVSTGYLFVQYFEIYNRYGQQVYAARGPAALEGWDGSYKGQPADMGVYYYHIHIESRAGRAITLKGDITLIR